MLVMSDSQKATSRNFKLSELIVLYVWCEYQSKRVCIHIIGFSSRTTDISTHDHVEELLIEEIIYKKYTTRQIKFTAPLI